MTDRSTESYRLAAPTSLSVRISSNLAGVVIGIGGGPSSSDPLAQRSMVRHFTTLSEALLPQRHRRSKRKQAKPKKRPNRLTISKRVRRKHRRAR